MKKYLIILPLLIITFTSCVNYSYKNMLHIRQGMSRIEVVEVLTSFMKPNLDVFMIDDASSDVYHISKMLKSKTKTTILIAQKISVSGKPYYIFAFENNKLIYWGLPTEFKRSSNEKIVKIGTEAVRIIHRDYLDD